MNNEDTVPPRIIAIRRNNVWYAAVSSTIFAGGGTGATSEKAINKAIAVFRTGKFGVDELARADLSVDELGEIKLKE